jgi:hypothetical protein
VKPDVGTILGLTAQRIAAGIADQGAAFAAGQAGLIGLMLGMSAAEYDRAADIRATENAELRALFAEIARDMADGALHAKLEDAAKTTDASLRVSVLNDANYALRLVLDEALIDAEARGAKASERRIWTTLQAMAARRIVPLGF